MFWMFSPIYSLFIQCLNSIFWWTEVKFQLSSFYQFVALWLVFCESWQRNVCLPLSCKNNTCGFLSRSFTVSAFYIKSYDSSQVNFHVWCEVWVAIDFFSACIASCFCLVAVWWMYFLSPLNFFYTQNSICVDLLLYILYSNPVIYLCLCQYHIVLIIQCIIVILK